MASTQSYAKETRRGRKAKGLTQKEVALALKMDASQYSRIENGKTDPSFTIVAKIAKALGVTLSELFQADEIFTDVHSADKTLMEKIKVMEQLNEAERSSLYHIIDGLFAKKKLKDTLSHALAQ
ncbi:MAG TPA: helix-turn-helix transcriptional regulator [Flavisolibacter sp.]|nr:helix-turn-helix transcriptional regulator [Flavisolibacter sp.]